MFGWAIVRAGLPIQVAAIGMVFFAGILGIFASDFVLGIIELIGDIWAGIIGFILWFIPDFFLIDKIDYREEAGIRIPVTIYPTEFGRFMNDLEDLFYTRSKGVAVTLFIIAYMAAEIASFVYFYKRSSQVARDNVRN